MSIFNIGSDILKVLAPEPDETAEPRPDQPRSEFLREEIRRLRRRRDKVARLIRLYVILGLLLTIGSVVAYLITRRSESWIGAAYGAMFLTVPLIRSSRSYDTDILTLESELDLLESTTTSPDQRAERLFKHHQYELKQYYDQTLGHSKWIFFIGVLCIFVGFGIIAATFALVVIPGVSANLSEKILVASLGGVGGILANFIAVIYLKMFSETVKTVAEFHNRLVSTHNLYFANFMATKVAEEKARDSVVSAIAQGIIKS